MNPFERTEQLIGAEAFTCLQQSRVILFGTGGVGSWCAEALVRSGIGHITIVDSDVVESSNLNRQLPALSSTIGRPKVEVLKERFLDINPLLDITALQERYTKGADFSLPQYDVIIDAIDSLSDKISLLSEASNAPGEVFSSMGAGRKITAGNIQVAEFWEVKGCPLAAAMRKKMRREGITTGKPVTCVFDDEVLPRQGTLVHITAMFGLTLAGLVIQHIAGKSL